MQDSFAAASLDHEPAASSLELAQKVLAEGIVDGLSHRFQQIRHQPLGYGVGIAASFLLGSTLGLACEHPLGRAAALTVTAFGLANLGMNSAMAGIAVWDTYRRPQNFRADEELVASTLGATVFDTALLSGLGIGGYAATRLSTRMGIAAKEITVPSSLTRLRVESSSVSDFGNMMTALDERSSLASARGKLAIPHYVGSAAEHIMPEILETEKDSTLARFYSDVGKSVVQVLSSNGENPASGTGFFVDKDLVATNYHVVRGAQNIVIGTVDGIGYSGRLVARDKAADLALVRTTSPNQHYQAIKLASDSSLQNGAKLLTLGHPNGFTQNILNLGNYQGRLYELISDSAKSAGDSLSSLRRTRVAAILADFAAQPGGSGSPVLNESAEVVGIVSQGENQASVATSVEHLKILIEETKSRPLVASWLDVRTRFNDEQGVAQVIFAREFPWKRAPAWRTVETLPDSDFQAKFVGNPEIMRLLKILQSFEPLRSNSGGMKRYKILPISEEF